MTPIILSIAFGALALLFACGLAYRVMREGQGDDTMRAIAQAIQEGALAFLRREYTWLAVFVAIIAVVLAVIPDIGWQTSIAYILGALASAFAGFLGMNVAIRANVRTTAAAERGLNPALRIAFSSGAVMGLTVVGLGLIGVSVLYLAFDDFKVAYIPGFSFGASSIALFARVGGGIYTKAADVGADLVGKVEQGIPEDDPRNPATIADNVGDNVGDVAGMGADLFESYVGSVIATMAIAVGAAAIIVDDVSNQYLVLPLILAGTGIIASIVGTFAVRTSEQATFSNLLWALRRGIFVAAALVAIAAWFLVDAMDVNTHIFWAIVAGLAAGVIIGLVTEFFTSYDYFPTKRIAESAQTGPATVIISGFATGMQSTVIPTLVIAGAVIAAFLLGA